MATRNLNATHLAHLLDDDPRWRVLRREIEKEHADDREPITMAPSREFRHASGEKRQKMIWGPSRMLDPEEGDPCPECGYPFGDDWDDRKLPSGPSIGETWNYTCPGCDQETASVGT